MIELKVVGNTITCVRTETIVQGQAETVRARVTLNSAWDSYAPLVAWRANGVERMSALVDGMTTVPWEVLQVATVLEVAVVGTLGAAVLSTPYISVGQIVPGPAPNALESAAPTPSVHEQLVRLSYEAIEKAQMAIDEAEDAVERVEQAAEEIEAAPLIRDEIAELADAAHQSEKIVVENAAAASRSAGEAAAHRAAAERAAASAAESADAALESRDTVLAGKDAALAAAEAAKKSEEAAARSSENAADDAESASASAGTAANAAVAASESAATAQEAAASAASDADRAEAAAEKAEQIAGGDWTTPEDVSGAIADHNADATAHEDIREAVAGQGNALVNHNAATDAHPDLTLTFTEATTLAKLTSGEKLKVLLGKIAKAVTDFIAHLADGVKHITAAERTAWNSKAAGSHTHTAAAVGAAASNHTHTPASIGAAASSHTHTASAITDLAAYLATQAGAKVELVSYVGTGVYGADNPTSVTFSFAPKVAIMLGWIEKYTYAADNRTVYSPATMIGGPYETDSFMVGDMLTTTPTANLGFSQDEYYGSYGWKSSDGKTLYWYNASSSAHAGLQCNWGGSTSTSGTGFYTYYVLGIG